MSKQKAPEPPDAVKNGDGSAREIWNAIWGNRVLIEGIRTEVRLLGVIVLLLAGAVIGGQII